MQTCAACAALKQQVAQRVSFFHAEDGIRALCVTRGQTSALPRSHVCIPAAIMTEQVNQPREGEQAEPVGCELPLNGLAPGLGYSQLNFTGSGEFLGNSTNSTLIASLGFPSAVGDTFTIVQSPGVLDR